MKASWIATISLGVLALGICALVEFHRVRQNILEPELKGFSRLKVSRNDLPSLARFAEHLADTAPRNGATRPATDGADTVGLLLSGALERRGFGQVEALLARLVRQDPRATLDVIRKLPVWAQSRATEVVFREWLKQSPDSAWAYIAEHEPRYFTNSEFIDALTVSGRFDLGARAINRLQALSERRVVAANLFQAWAAIDLNGFSNWARTLPSDVKGAANAEIAARFYAEGPVDQNSLDSLLGQNQSDINTSWSAFARRLVSGAGYSRAKEIFNQITQPAGNGGGAYAALAYAGPAEDAAGWLARISSPSSRDAAIFGVVSKLATNGDPAGAARIAVMSSNQAVIDLQMTRNIPAWAAKDPVAAMNFLQTTTNISASVKAKLLSTIAPLLPPPT